MSRQRRQCVRNFRRPVRVATLAAMSSAIAPKGRRSRNGTTIAFIAVAGRCVGPDGVEGDQRPVGRCARDAEAGGGGHPRARLPAGRSRAAGRAHPGADLPRARQRVGARDRPGRGARRRSPSSVGRPLGDAGPPDPGSRLDRERPGPAPDRRDRGLLRPQRDDAPPAPDAGHPVRDRRSDRRAGPRHAVGRGHELERRA